MDFIVVIPARLGSARFPGKVLADVCGKPMVVRVMEAALESGAKKVIVATDSIEVKKKIRSIYSKSEVFLTYNNHQSGTERLAEVARYYDFLNNQIIVHLQSDEPLVSSTIIYQAALITNEIVDKFVSMVTFASPLDSLEKMHDENIVKVVVDRENNALYFSRSMIPWFNDNFNFNHNKFKCVLLRHIGIYSYKVRFLHSYIQWGQSPLEKLEKLEQLRVLWNGKKIRVSILSEDMSFISVDTPESLVYVNKLFQKLNS